MRVQLSAHSVVPGENLTLRISEYGANLDATSLGLQVFEVGHIDTSLRLATALPVNVGDAGIGVTLEQTDNLEAGSVYEIKVLEPRVQEGVLATFVGGRDFERVFFQVEASTEQHSPSSEDVSAVAGEIERRRETRFAEPLGNQATPDNDEFRVLMFAERVLLTTPLRVPGIEMLPLSTGNTSTDEAKIVNRVLADLNWQGAVDPSWWAEQNSRDRPIVLFKIPRLLAKSADDAMEIAHSRRDRLLDLLALHRGSSGIPFATVVQELADRANNRYGEMNIYTLGRSYTGNLLGGFLSGESSRSLIAHDQAAEADPFLGLCISLFREARAEYHPDLAYFRFWGLLEILAGERVEECAPVTDLEGRELQVGNRAANTSYTRDRVYELLKGWMLTRSFSEQSFTDPVTRSLWEAVGVWYARRNATAHYGGFRIGDAAQQRQNWYPRALESHVAVARQGGIDHYLRNLREVASNVMEWELHAAAPRPPH